MTVFVYVNTSRQVGDAEHIKVFATQDAAENWFEENDPEGVAFEYEVLEWSKAAYIHTRTPIAVTVKATRRPWTVHMSNRFQP